MASPKKVKLCLFLCTITLHWIVLETSVSPVYTTHCWSSLPEFEHLDLCGRTRVSKRSGWLPTTVLTLPQNRY